MNEKNLKKTMQKTALSEPDPNKWATWLKIIIAILSAILGIIGENQLDIVNQIINLL